MTRLLRYLSILSMLVFCASLSAAATAGSQPAFDEFDIDGEAFAVPAPKGLCKVTDDDLRNTGLRDIVLGPISRTLDIRSVRMTCKMRNAIREGRQPENGQTHMIAFVRLQGGSTTLDNAALSQFNMIKTVFQFSPDHPARRAVEIGLLNALKGQGKRNATCASIESSQSELGGELCLERSRAGRALHLDMAAAARPISNRMVVVLIINANLPPDNRPRFRDAAASLGQIQPAIRQ